VTDETVGKDAKQPVTDRPQTEDADEPRKPVTWSMGAHLYPLTELVQDPMEYVKVRVAQPHPGVGHVACLYGLRRRAKGRKVMTDHQVAIPAEHLVGSLIAGNAPVAIGP
jgi:hypothetical protein